MCNLKRYKSPIKQKQKCRSVGNEGWEIVVGKPILQYMAYAFND